MVGHSAEQGQTVPALLVRLGAAGHYRDWLLLGETSMQAAAGAEPLSDLHGVHPVLPWHEGQKGGRRRVSLHC